MMKHNKNGVFRSRSEGLFNACVCILLFGAIAIALYPLIYIFSNSISGSAYVVRREIWLWPRGINFANYVKALEHKDILRSFINAFAYTTVGTTWSMLLTILGAYPLSRKYLPGRNCIMLAITFTMMFSAGMIPLYLTIKELKLLNTFWVMIIPCAVSQYNLIVLRSGFQSIPAELEESARIDGANDFVILARIMIPLTLPFLMTVTLFYFIGRWNDFFSAMIYLNDRSKYPLQLILRELLIESSDSSTAAVMRTGASTISPFGYKCAIIIISILPMLVVYPFIQRYFVKGVMIGAVKG